MDKIQPTHYNVKHRQGFALMITLSVLAVIIALTMVLLSYFDEVRQDASKTKALIQANVYYADVTTLFKDFKEKKTLFSTLYMFPIPLYSSDSEFSMILYCQALASGVNINWLGMDNNTQMREAYTISQTVFDRLAQEYNLEDAQRLQEMLLEEIGGNEKFVKKQYSRLRQKNGIISYKQFADIVSRYQFEVDDPKVSLVPWEKYFSFSSTAPVIDAEYSSPELISFLFDIDLQTVRQWHANIEKKSSLEDFVEYNGGDYALRKEILAGETFLEESECTVSYTSTGEQYRFRFEYIQGEAKHFEFYGKY